MIVGWRGANALTRACAVMTMVTATAAAVAAQAGQGGRGAAPAPQSAQAVAPIDLTGYWVSLIVDEWRFRVSPQKGDILYLPLNNEAKRIANAWDPAKDESEGRRCMAYGAIGVMQRPGRLHITWQDPNTLRIDTDAGTQTRLLRFLPRAGDKSQPSGQGTSTAAWEVNGRVLIDTGGTGFVPALRQNGTSQSGSLRATTTNMQAGYLRKNGVPYSDNAVLTEHFNVLTGQQNDSYLALTAIVEDPVYLTGPFVRTYNFKKQRDASGWDPTPCWNR